MIKISQPTNAMMKYNNKFFSENFHHVLIISYFIMIEIKRESSMKLYCFVVSRNQLHFVFKCTKEKTILFLCTFHITLAKHAMLELCTVCMSCMYVCCQCNVLNLNFLTGFPPLPLVKKDLHGITSSCIHRITL